MEPGDIPEGSPPPGVLGEHCYSKHPPGIEEPMETSTEPMDTSTEPTTPILTSLDRSMDNFESLLLVLLRAHTVQTQPESSPPPPGEPSVPISGKALDTLSAEQIKALITSNSVNYEVIQQILAEQRGRPAIASAARIRREGEGEGSGQSDQVPLLGDNNGGGEGGGELSKSLSPPSLQAPPTSSAPSSSSSLSTINDANQQLQQLIQITPQQLQTLQSQVNELLQSQRVSLPPDLTPEQQQQLIQTLLLRQLHLQQSGGVATISLKDGSMAMKQLLAESGLQGPVLGVGSKEGGGTGGGVGGDTGVQEGGGQGGGGGEGGDILAKTAIVPPQTGGYLTGAAISAVSQANAAATGGRERGGRKAGGNKAAGGGGGPGRKKKEAAKAKKVPMPYNLFFMEVYSTVMATKPKMGHSDVSKIISKMWAAMGPDVKKRYYDEHERLKAEQKAEEDAASATTTPTPITPSTSEDNNSTLAALISSSPSPALTSPGPSPALTSPSPSAEGLSIRSLIAGAPVTSSATSVGVNSGEQASTPVVAVENPILGAALTAGVVAPRAGVTSEAGAVVMEGQVREGVGEGRRRKGSELKMALEAVCPVKDPHLCANQDCVNTAVFVEDRGPKYCSNDCVVNHCRNVFEAFYPGKKIPT